MFRYAMIAAILLVSPWYSATADSEIPEFHDDYYEGFAQGVYYGLLLRDEPYEVAWCMKSELGYEAKGLGTGEDFQQKLNGLLASCRKTAKTAAQFDPNSQ